MSDAPGAEPYPPALRDRLTAALAARGPGYRPRTHHLRDDGSPVFVNRLILQTSPYLTQHAHNPVDWRPWGDEAFEAARRLDRPVLLSIGYSTCHWCHVMERESFEDRSIAEYINGHFVAIKVDREERPDVDAVYMAAVQAMTGHGGWPLTAVLTPDGEPFFTGTYFPPRDRMRGARVGFTTILAELDRVWRDERPRAVGQAARLSLAVSRMASAHTAGEVDVAAALDLGAQGWSGSFDERWGGFGQGQKFPRPSTLLALLRHHRRRGDARSLEMVRITLDRMLEGGIRDHVGGGFHRYTVESSWLVPHFEKMLYDNAQLAVTYLEGFQATGDPAYAAVARETLDYVVREMSCPDGGFYSATDADSPAPSGQDEEGWFFTWTPAELESLLGTERAARFGRYYGVSPSGNFEGRNILSTRGRTLEEVAGQLGATAEALDAELVLARGELYEARKLRPPPGLDDKILLAWNGLMIEAFARGGAVLGEPDYTARAAAAADFALSELRRPDGRLLRSWNDGPGEADAVLDDHVFLISGLLELFEATWEPRWLQEAVAIQAIVDARFGEPRGGWFLTADDAEQLLVRSRPDWDGAMPSGNSTGALNLLRLAELTGDESYRQRAVQVIEAFGQPLATHPTGLPKMLCAADFARGPVTEVIVVVPSEVADAEPFLAELRRVWLPNKVVVVAVEGDEALAGLVPLAADRTAIDGKAAAYLCEGGVCTLPTTDPAEFARRLQPGVKPGVRT